MSISPNAPTFGEYLLEALRPRHGGVPFDGCAFFCFIVRLALVTFAPLRRRHQGTVLAVRGKHTVETRQVDSGPGYQGCQFCNEIQWLEYDVRGATPVRRLKRVTDVAVRRD